MNLNGIKLNKDFTIEIIAKVLMSHYMGVHQAHVVAEEIYPIIGKAIQTANQQLADKIFEDLGNAVGYDGHTVALRKNDLIEIAKKYNVEMEEN